jgi:hypothetical protein
MNTIIFHDFEPFRLSETSLGLIAQHFVHEAAPGFDHLSHDVSPGVNDRV